MFQILSLFLCVSKKNKGFESGMQRTSTEIVPGFIIYLFIYSGPAKQRV